MKKEIHPPYYPRATVRCACGNVFTVGATQPKIETEICWRCHPFYTGHEKIVDTAGRVERFRKKLAKRDTLAKTRTQKKERKRKQQPPRKLGG